MKLPTIIDKANSDAIYFPSIQPQYANQGLMLGLKFRSFSPAIKLLDFDFTDINSRLFTLPHVLHSAGIVNKHANPANNLMHNSYFKLNRVFLAMADSGGKQIATGVMSPTQQQIRDIFDWQCKYSDIAMTLDVPLGALSGANSHIYSDFEGCLHLNLANLQNYVNWGANKHRYLNVLQGRDLTESDDWYSAVKGFDLYGWAFSYNHRMSMPIIIWRLLHLIKDGKFDKSEVWLHFLGAGDLKSAFMFTVIKQALNKRFADCDIEVSFDTSTPFLLGGKHLTMLLDAVISPSRMTTPNLPLNKGTQKQWMNSKQPLPCTSTKISQHVSKGDIVRNFQGTPWIDETSYLILQNHNVEVAINAYDEVNAVYNDKITSYHSTVPLNLAKAADAVFEILSVNDIKKSFKLLTTGASNKIIKDMYK